MKLTVILITGVALLSVSCAQKETGLSEKELIGKAIFSMSPCLSRRDNHVPLAISRKKVLPTNTPVSPRKEP